MPEQKDPKAPVFNPKIKETIAAFKAENSPYIWLRCPGNMKSWEFFDWLLENCGVVGTPGVGFGECGEGYFRLTAFGDAEKTKMAAERIKTAIKAL